MAQSRPSRENRDAPLFGPSPSDLDLYQTHVEEMMLQESGVVARQATNQKKLLAEVLDISPFLNEAASAMVDDSFTRCFKSNAPEPWNWNWYLFPLWCIGAVVRYGILFPLRFLLLIGGWVLFLILFIPVHFLLTGQPKLQKEIEVQLKGTDHTLLQETKPVFTCFALQIVQRSLIELMCGVFVASWTGVVRYHGPRPSRRANHIWVANHTSMIDFIILEQMTAFAVIMQKHQGWVGLVQTNILDSLGCIWFNRTEAKDRALVVEKIKKHVIDPESNPLLVFPEGTCVNNEYIVMFKKGMFELGCTICPIAIKYNKIFVDAFWNSRKQSFTSHLLRLMTSWAVVCEVWYLEPQKILPGETAIDFADRVRGIIANRAGIKKVPWDGLYKYYQPSPKLTQMKQKTYAEQMKQRVPAMPRAGRESAMEPIFEE